MHIYKKMWVVLTVAILAFMINCGSNKQQTASQEASQPGQQSTASSAAQQQAAPTAPVQQQAKESSAAPRAPLVKTYTIAAGTALEVRLNDSISSGTATAGAPFGGTLAVPLVKGSVVLAPEGSPVEGQVVSADKGGRLHHPAELVLSLTSLRPTGGSKVALTTRTWSMRANNYKKRDAEMIGGGAGVGALVGALAGKGKGALVGALVGGGAGTAGAAFTGKKQIVLQPETRLKFMLSQPVAITQKTR
ncbi:MAG: hypothetical protein ACRD22_14780 [Terriglobia bacterium]